MNNESAFRTFEKIQKIANRPFKPAGHTASLEVMKLALQEIFTVANEAIAEMQTPRDAFWERFHAENDPKPVSVAMKKYGFEVYHSGGGCSALKKKNPDGSYWFLTCQDDASIPNPTDPSYLAFYHFEDAEDHNAEKSHEFSDLQGLIDFCEVRFNG